MDIDFLAPEAIEDPHAFFRRLRDARPIAWSERHRAWIVTGHPELKSAFRDRRLSTERMASFRSRQTATRARALEKALELLEGWMLFHEPPTHTRLRAPLMRRFTASAVARLQSDVEELTDGLLDRLEASGEGDLVESFAHPLPAAVIARLFGVPDDERTWLTDWSARFGVVVFGAVGRDDYEEQAQRAGEEFHDRIGRLMERYRARPEDNLVSLLLSIEGQQNGLTTAEILGACSILLFAGHDTTASFLGSATLALLDDPEALARFRSLESDAEIDTAIEELLRFESPAKAMMRQVAEAHEVEGHRFEEGQAVFMTILAANRDPRVFDDPDRLLLDRQANPHLTFGYGHHFCLGAALARLEARVALRRLFDRLPGVRVTGPVAWKPNISDRSAARIPVATR